MEAMEIFLEAAKWIVSRSDPVLVVSMLILGVWQHRTSKALAAHLGADNRYPHPQCFHGEQSYKSLAHQIDTVHAENREDHQELFRLIRGGK
jgi:hypothetical protein